MKHFESSKDCPTCDKQVHETNPLETLRSVVLSELSSHRLTHHSFAARTVRYKRSFIKSSPGCWKVIGCRLWLCCSHFTEEKKREEEFCRLNQLPLPSGITPHPSSLARSILTMHFLTQTLNRAIHPPSLEKNAQGRQYVLFGKLSQLIFCSNTSRSRHPRKSNSSLYQAEKTKKQVIRSRR